ncbi:MAG: alanine--tRNA ligase [Acidobacteria bacterium]|nr:alanine--tRNA ligase [Acidobacteriota bacterium]
MTFTSDEIRQQFIDFFVERGHTEVASGSLIPADDPTLLFTNAGMNQFKSVFLGEVERSYPRAVTSQKCMRVSGKHNDLENVGPSLYHHTFFEMLGNFSFGDYFKEEAIRLAWELFTEVFKLDKERLWATVYTDDDEAAELWVRETDVPASRVVRLGRKDNYWSMGDTGPCGPCSELHYDYDLDSLGATDEPDFDSDRFVELWNLVFMQFNAGADGEVAPLPSPNIDTGAGLERLVAVLNGTRSNYETDLFQPLIRSVASPRGVVYGSDDETDVALRAIADHSRALSFLLSDGVMPANEGRGYVLRRLLRRAMRFGMKLGYDTPFLHSATGVVIDQMGSTYPELKEHAEVIGRVVKGEEDRFLSTLASGSGKFNDLIADLRSRDESVIPGDQAFRLYDTHGLPIEMTREFATAENMTVDEAGFSEALEAQRSRGRSAWKGSGDDAFRELVRKLGAEHGPTEFLAYSHSALEGAEVLALVRDGELVDSLEDTDDGFVVLDRTPFYAESGGQVGDTGEITGPSGSAQVGDTQRPAAGVIVHSVTVARGRVAVGDRVSATIDAKRREDIKRNHTATHLLHAALRNQLGEHVRQAGSLVEPDRLRFDFTHFEPVEVEQIESLETAVNLDVRADGPVETEEMAYDTAIDRGALAFFGEKYGDDVRVVNVPGVSMELCGGIHVARTGEIGMMAIQREESVAAGTRRIEAVTGERAVAALQHYRQLVRGAATRARTQEDTLEESIGKLVDRAASAEREVEDLRLKLASQGGGAGDSDEVEVAGIRVVRQLVQDLDGGGMRQLVDEVKNRIGSGIVVLGSQRGGKAALAVGVTDDLTDRIGAGDIVNRVAPVMGGGGGGHKGMAQAGGPDAAKVTAALEQSPELIGDLLE